MLTNVLRSQEKLMSKIAKPWDNQNRTQGSANRYAGGYDQRHKRLLKRMTLFPIGQKMVARDVMCVVNTATSNAVAARVMIGILPRHALLFLSSSSNSRETRAPFTVVVSG